MHNCSARDVTRFSSRERRALFYAARSIVHELAFDMRAARSSHPFGRILIITPKKMGNAPQRNLAKRRLKALFYEEKLYEKQIDIIVYCKKDALTLRYQELKSLVLAACLKAEQKLNDQAHH